MLKDEIIEIEITDQTDDGKGIGHAGGMAVFVSGAAAGDVVRARVTKVKKRYAFAVCEEVLKPSPHRIKPMCPYLADCGGCAFGELSYEKELEIKRQHVIEKLRRIGGVEDADTLVRDIVGMAPDDEPANYNGAPLYSRASEPDGEAWVPKGYRNKTVMAVDPATASVGYYARASRRITDCEACMLQAPPAGAAALALRGYLLSHPGADIHSLMVKTAFATGEVMVVIGSGSGELDDEEDLICALDDAVLLLNDEAHDCAPEYSLESVAVTYSRREAGSFFGAHTEIIAGRNTIEDELLGLRFEISPESFYQVNPVQAAKLYDKALEYAQVETAETVFDLYCGTGTIGLIAASRGAEEVIGIESVRSAVLDANRNAVINGIVNARFVCGKAEDELPKILAERTGGSKDVIILDPPRAGCAESLLDAAASASPERIVYISCNPATLARDVKYLQGRGYELIEAAPFDLFGRTAHVETVVQLSKGNISSEKIRVEFNLED
ncbi:MAG: 23S rRNA (uracil(1939)-C(5))-methyltransferase RlmD, partial [Firmicutes bacterium]|nr:23S rRNA (uracil(1939)-C(5))-methyltransferase RlmD [Bacillota bacterium]